MVRISALSDDLLLKILSFLPTKVAVSTSILSKQWQFLWLWLPKLEFDDLDFSPSSALCCLDFIDKNLPLHRAPVIESLLLRFCQSRLPQPDNSKRWVGIAVSRSVRELSIFYFTPKPHDVIPLPSSLYSCNSLMTLKLEGYINLVDVPRIVCLPTLKTLELRGVTYSNEDSLRVLLSHCPVLEDLLIERYDEDDNVRALVVNVPSLQRLTLDIGCDCSSDEYVIVTPSLKYFKIIDYRDISSYLIEPMPNLEEADIEVMRDTEEILESITSVRRLSFYQPFNTARESVYRAGIVFDQLEHLKLCIYKTNWSKLLVWLLGNSPNLRVLKLNGERDSKFEEYEPVGWENEHISVPECLLRSLETFEFKGDKGTQEERDFLSFLGKHACFLKS
ncbi:unnamed protein product [Microthlaspi erraticum]|uniref:FBD domain-containing protein n=1 Tax=Microthlaspi erraticum TaxID=1685480 RepID=A0A6D2KF44_9BRAS|nr:unnamed protein product [Microthlaspi erraticum]